MSRLFRNANKPTGLSSNATKRVAATLAAAILASGLGMATAIPASAAAIVVDPERPIWTDLPGVKNDTYTIPKVAGVDYLVGGAGGTLVGPGVHAAPTGVIFVYPKLRPGYVLPPGRINASWVKKFYGMLSAPVPTISGTLKVGSTLTANLGTWGPEPTALVAQWYRSGVPIFDDVNGNANGYTYTLTAADAGKQISVKIDGYPTTHHPAAVTRTSVKTTAIANGTLAAPTPKITGIAKVGSTLTATTGTWGPAPVTLKRQWYRSGVAITGATASTYKLTSLDVGKAVTVRVTGTKAGYTTAVKTSTATASVVK